MGVADNRTYKNEYLFTGKYDSVLKSPSETAKDNPSINVDPKVNTTIKENPYRSNVEIEGDEIVLQPDLSALFKAVGKSHKQGGMDVLLKPEAFIFSDYDGLKLSPKDHDLFELKEGGKNATDTPADVLKRNVDIKHYNNLITILGDPFKDDLAKKSATRMLDQYIKKLGNIAFIQESKKGFPQGLPSFSEGTAPVYDPSLKEKIMENKQYAKAGGTVNNPYQVGGFSNPMFRQQSNNNVGKYPIYGPNGEIIGWIDENGNKTGTSQELPIVTLPTQKNPTPRQDRYIGQRPPYPNTWTNYYDKSQKQQYNSPDWIDPKTFYSTPGLIDYMKTLDKQSGVDWDMNKADDAVWGWRHNAALAKFFPNGKPVPPQEGPGNVPHDWGDTSIDAPKPSNLPVPGTVNGPAQGQKQANWNFTPWQRASHLHDWMNWATVNKYGPDRAHYNATYINPALVNPEQAVGDARTLANQQITSANVLNPILRNAQAAGAYGQFLDKIPGIRSQYDNQNVGIVNQFRQYNNQIKNNESLVNMQNDKDYSRDNVTANVNYDNMKTYLKNQAVSNTMTDVATNQKLAYNLLTQNNPAYGFDWNTGNFYRNPKSILDATTGDAKSDMYTELAQNIMTKIRSGKNPTPEEIGFIKALSVGKLNFSGGSDAGPFKKGGKVRNPYK